jgi:hypothetical protein
LVLLLKYKNRDNIKTKLFFLKAAAIAVKVAVIGKSAALFKTAATIAAKGGL